MKHYEDMGMVEAAEDMKKNISLRGPELETIKKSK